MLSISLIYISPHLQNRNNLIFPPFKHLLRRFQLPYFSWEYKTSYGDCERLADWASNFNFEILYNSEFLKLSVLEDGIRTQIQI